VAGTGLSYSLTDQEINVSYGSSAGNAVQGNTTVSVTGTANEIEITGTTAQALGGGAAYTIGLPDAVTITDSLTVNFGGNVVTAAAVTMVADGGASSASHVNVNVAGNFINSQGFILGKHKGIANYTIGQRKGLGIGGSQFPLYVINIDKEKNEVMLGEENLLKKTIIVLENINWLDESINKTNLKCFAKIQ
jgi:hypothetical protein